VAAGERARILLGRVLGAHGLRGEILIETFAHPPENIVAYGTLTDRDGLRRFALQVVRVTPKGLVARLAGINDRDAALALKGVEFFIDRDQLPATGEGEFYHADLLGLAVIDAAAAVIGTVVGVHNFGAGDLLEIRLTTGRSELVPFSERFVGEVDLERRRLLVAWPGGLKPVAREPRLDPGRGSAPKGARRAKASGLRR